MKSRAIDNRITEGVIWKELIRYALPLLAGNLFQQLYNTVDSVIVGRFVGTTALAAVGSTMGVINMIIGFVMGIANGCGVVLAQSYGAKDREACQKTIHTAIATMIVASLIISVVGVVFTPWIVKIMRTPADVYDGAVIYLRIFLGGSLAMVIYNACAGFLQAVGDSRRPLIYLITASVTNIILDIVFVTVFKLGVAGVAIATVIAMILSACLALRALTHDDDIYKLDLRKLRIDGNYLRKVMTIGLPAGAQQSIIAFSNIIVQSHINIYGSAVIAGVTAFYKLDAFILLPIMSLALAATTFVGQNIGAKKYDRVKKVALTTILMTGGISIALSTILILTTNKLLYLFTNDPEVIHYGLVVMKWMAPYYVLVGTSQICGAVIRGSGNALIPMFFMVGNYCVLRIIYLLISDALFPSFVAVMAGYPITWLTCATMMVTYLLKGPWLKRHELG